VKVVARTDEYTIFEKRNSRYGVRRNDRQWINGDDKVAILREHGLIKVPEPKVAEPEPAEAEAQADAEATEDATAEAVEAEEADGKAD